MLAYIARRCMELDTVMAHAFRRALGIEAPCKDATIPIAAPRASVYAGLEECMGQRYGVRL